MRKVGPGGSGSGLLDQESLGHVGPFRIEVGSSTTSFRAARRFEDRTKISEAGQDFRFFRAELMSLGLKRIRSCLKAFRNDFRWEM